MLVIECLRGDVSHQMPEPDCTDDASVMSVRAYNATHSASTHFLFFIAMELTGGRNMHSSRVSRVESRPSVRRRRSEVDQDPEEE